MRAYIESNAAVTGAAALERAWNDMMSEIREKLAAIPKAIRDAALSAASDTIHMTTGVPVWAWAVGGVAVVSAVGLTVWKIINSRSGAAITGAVARRYLP
jgi:hypothetical protein